MKRLLNILALLFLTSFCFAQEETRVIDSLESVMAAQVGREKVLTMIELSYAFFDYSFDDCVDWGEKAKRLSHEIGDVELEADAVYSLGMNYGYHNDLDLAQSCLRQSYELYHQADKEDKAFEALWNQAYFELVLGNMDSAYNVFLTVKALAEKRNDVMACAQTSSNLAAIQYQRGEFDKAIESFKLGRDFYAQLNDSAAMAQTDVNMATVYSELGKWAEARRLYVSVIPRLVALRDYYYLLLTYKNYGSLFERDIVNYDSANYYLAKALAVTEMEGISRADWQTMVNTKADVLAELGNVAYAQGKCKEAIDDYECAMELARNNSYHFGQMQALIGLGQVYAEQGNAAKSMQYLERYAEAVSQSGITMMEPTIKKSLILNYARLGRYHEMQTELDALDEQRADALRKYAGLLEESQIVSENFADLLQKYELESRQVEFFQAQRNQYRLAFFGLLTLMIAAIAFFVLWSIIQKNQQKNAEE